MSEAQLVLKAVKQENVSAKQGFLQKLFAFWFDAFVYNQIWEDPKVDLEALTIDQSSRILTISSGGCNVLNYLIETPESITAIDLNRHHIYLLNLKLACLKHCETFEDFFNFFGFGKHPRNVDNYRNFIAPNLDEQTRHFWDSNSFWGKISSGDRINYFDSDGLYEHSRNGYFLRFFHRFSRLLGCRPEKMIEVQPNEQQQYFDQFIAPFFNSFIIRLIGKLPITTFGLGIPPQQLEELKKDLAADGTLADIFLERAHRLAVEFPIADNYFAWQAFARKYDTVNRTAIPEYLKEPNFASLRQKSGRVTTKIGAVTEEIDNSPENAFNRFVFLDAQDWMNKDSIVKLWQAIAEKGEKGSRIIFRTAGAASPIESNLPKDLREKFEYQQEISQNLFKKDRASIYGGFHLYILKP